MSLAPNTTEILFALGLGDSIVAVDEYSNYPEEAKNIERIGTFLNPNIEKMILLRPGYILTNTDMPHDKREYLETLGARIIKVSPLSVNGFLKDIENLGDIFNRREKAGLIIDDIKNRINALPVADKPKVFVQLFDDPLVTVSSFIGDVIEAAGGKNIASDIKDDAGLFSMEELIYRDPDIIVAVGFSSEFKIPSSIKAVRGNRIIRDLDPDILLRPGPRIIDAIEALNRFFYEKG